MPKRVSKDGPIVIFWLFRHLHWPRQQKQPSLTFSSGYDRKGSSDRMLQLGAEQILRLEPKIRRNFGKLFSRQLVPKVIKTWSCDLLNDH